MISALHEKKFVFFANSFHLKDVFAYMQDGGVILGVT